jgi:hypothetical protein
VSNLIQRTRCRDCKQCDTWGSVVWKQKAALTGHLVEVVWRCSCRAGIDNYPNLPPLTQIPQGDYPTLGEE